MAILHSILHNIKSLCIKATVHIISCFCPIDKKKVFFISFLGLSYSDNPRAISEKLHELNPDIKIIWSFQSPQSKESIIPAYVNVVKTGSLKELYEQTTSGVWVDNYCKSVNTIKRDGQLYIQTWHGDRAIKKVLYDANPNNELNLYESNNVDLAVAGSVFGERMYRSAFKYFGEVLTVGCPRNDILITDSKEDRIRFYDHYGIPHHLKLLLLAPTFRDSNSSGVQHISGLNLEEIMNILKEKTGNEWALIVRGHTGRKLEFDYPYSGLLFDVSDYEDSKYVLLSSDAIISDYSTMSTDFILTGKPTYLYINDYNEYASKDRALWFDLKKTPFWCAETNQELVELIKCNDLNDSGENCTSILDMYESKESGRSAEIVCNWIIKHLNDTSRH